MLLEQHLLGTYLVIPEGVRAVRWGHQVPPAQCMLIGAAAPGALGERGIEDIPFIETIGHIKTRAGWQRHETPDRARVGCGADVGEAALQGGRIAPGPAVTGADSDTPARRQREINLREARNFQPVEERSVVSARVSR